MKSKEMFKLALVSAAAALLVACGGGGDGAAAQADATAGAETGVLTDSPIGGVEYTTSSGYTGLTDANGNYNYNPGETVTFKIGGITLGTVQASATITPLELASGDANKVTNLLVLFQSLDADGDASNGITVTPAARTAAAGVTLDFTAAPATFASTGNSALVTLMASAGTTNTEPVSPEHALAHFESQFMNSLRGGWVGVIDGKTSVFRFEADGHYIMGETGVPEGDGKPGIEDGRIDWNAATGVTSATIGLDGNGDWGLSSLTSGATFRVDGDTLVVKEGDETFTFKRVPNTTASIVGAWTLGTSSTDLSKQTFFFLPAREGATHTSYLMLDPVGNDGGKCDADATLQIGLEVGQYVFEGGNLKVTQAPVVDQNSCAGLWDKPAGTGSNLPLVISSDGATATVDGQTLYRVGR